MKNLALHFKSSRRFLSFGLGGLLFCFLVQGYGQGTLQSVFITFDGTPTQPPRTAYTTTNYMEAGVSFTPIGRTSSFGRVGSNPVPARPDNGSAYLQAGLGDSLSFTFTTGAVFSMNSVDLAEYSTVLPNAVTVHFIGYRLDGSIVTADLTTDGIIDGTGPLQDFQTFTFGPEFSGLTRVDIPSFPWSLDNLVLAIPEPSSTTLFILGGLLLWAAKSGGRVLNQFSAKVNAFGRIHPVEISGSAAAPAAVRRALAPNLRETHTPISPLVHTQRPTTRASSAAPGVGALPIPTASFRFRS